MISVVILSYNHANYIKETLHSAYEIELEKEVIIIDDGSTDDSERIIDNYIKDNDLGNITTFITKKNCGLIDSLNRALALAKHEYIYFIASDDIIIPFSFKELFEKISVNNKAVMALGNAYIYFEKKGLHNKTYNQEHTTFFNKNDREIRRDIFIDYPKPLLLQTAIFRTDALKNIGGWDKKLIWDDYPMFVKLLKAYSIENGDILFLKDIIVAKYRQHATNTYKNLNKQLCMVEQAMKLLAPEGIYSKAMAKQYAFYFLMSLKHNDINVLNMILRSALKKNIFFLFIKFLASEIAMWVLRRIR